MSPLTKILVVLNLVFSVALSVLVVLMVAKQDNYKSTAENEHAKAAALSGQLVAEQARNQNYMGERDSASQSAKNASDTLAELRRTNATKISELESANIALKGDNDSMQTQVKSLSAAVSTLTAVNNAKDSELASLRPQVTKLTTDYNVVAQKLNESDNQLRAAEQAIRKLQEASVVNAPAGGATGPMSGNGQVQALTSATPSASRINAKISKTGVSAGRTLIELPLGTRDGISVNTKLYVYRATGYVADAVVESATADASVASVTKTKEGASVQVGDTVSTLGQ